MSLVLPKLVPEFLKIINPTRFTIYFDTLGVPDMQFLESICIIDVDVDHYKNILDYLLGVLSIGKINPIFFLGTIKATIFAIYFDTLGVRDMQFQNQFVLLMLM